MNTIELSVSGMSCGHCVTTVKSALAAVEGVSEVDVSLTAEKATVKADDYVREGALLEAVHRAGYSASLR